MSMDPSISTTSNRPPVTGTISIAAQEAVFVEIELKH
jgi:hypothetical protein